MDYYDVTSALREAESHDASQRMKAVQALADIATQDPRARIALNSLTRDRDPEVREEAIRAVEDLETTLPPTRLDPRAEPKEPAEPAEPTTQGSRFRRFAIAGFLGWGALRSIWVLSGTGIDIKADPLAALHIFVISSAILGVFYLVSTALRR